MNISPNKALHTGGNSAALNYRRQALLYGFSVVTIHDNNKVQMMKLIAVYLTLGLVGRGTTSDRLIVNRACAKNRAAPVTSTLGIIHKGIF